MAVKRNYRINLRNYGNPPAIMVSQYDENYDLVFEVYDGVVPATGLNVYTVKLVGRQPGDDPTLKYEFTGTVSGIANNILSFTIDTTMTGRAGKGVAEIVILDTTNDVKFASFNLPVYVENAAVPDDAVDADVERAQEIADEVAEIVDGATEGAEAWAVGQRGGVDVPSTDPTYENNAKYYAQQAAQIAEDISGVTEQVATNTSDISDLKEDLNAEISARESAVSAESARAEAEEARIEALFTADVSEAVNDWLDEHPEATTTVEDGSLSVAKFTEEAQAQVLNDYATPEMFGAVGDGTTDDTQAIANMFASDNTVFWFPKKTYKVDGSIDVDKSCNIFFNDTTFAVPTNKRSTRNYEYVLAFKHTYISTFGVLTISCNKGCNIGIWLENCAHSNFDTFIVGGARIWGIYMNSSSTGNGSMKFNMISVTNCGYKVTAKAKYKSATEFELTDIYCSLFFTANPELTRSVFENQYEQTLYLIDDSGYDLIANAHLVNRAVFKGKNRTTPNFVLDENDVSKGTFISTSAVNYLKPSSSFVDGDDGRNVFIPVGGGVRFGSASSEGLYQIRKFNSMRNPISFYSNMGYGGIIESYSSQYDTVIFATETTYSLDIRYMYVEAMGTGYIYTDHYTAIYAIANTSDSCIQVGTLMNRLGFYQENEVVLGIQTSTAMKVESVLHAPDYMALKKLEAPNISNTSSSLIVNIDEYSCRSFTGEVGGFRDAGTFTINLRDPNAYRRNKFSPFTAYFKKLQSYTTPLKITLNSNLLTLGYTINGSVDNVLSVYPADYNNIFKITIILFGKTFYVTAEALTFVNNSV